MIEIDPQWLQYANPEQKRALAAVKKHGTARRAAAALGVGLRTVERRLAEVRKAAARRGHSPTEDADGTAPAGFHVSGKTILHDADGNVKLQWVKKRADRDRVQLEDLIEQARESLTDLAGTAKPRPSPASAAQDLCAVYAIGDPHFGLLAWEGDAEDAV